MHSHKKLSITINTCTRRRRGSVVVVIVWHEQVVFLQHGGEVLGDGGAAVDKGPRHEKDPQHPQRVGPRGSGGNGQLDGSRGATGHAPPEVRQQRAHARHLSSTGPSTNKWGGVTRLRSRTEMAVSGLGTRLGSSWTVYILYTVHRHDRHIQTCILVPQAPWTSISNLSLYFPQGVNIIMHFKGSC